MHIGFCRYLGQPTFYVGKWRFMLWGFAYGVRGFFQPYETRRITGGRCWHLGPVSVYRYD